MIAGGFVLGEVLILLHILEVWQVTGLLVLSVALFTIRRLTAAGRIKEHQGSRGAYWRLLLFCVSVWLGMMRAQAQQQRTEAAEMAAAAIEEQGRTVISGTVQAITETELDIRLEVRQLGQQHRTDRIGQMNRSSQLQGVLVVCNKDNRSSSLKLGMKVLVSGKMRIFPVPRNPGEFHSRNYYRGLKLNGRFRAESLTIVDEHSYLLKERLRQLRINCGKILKMLVREPEAGIFQAAVLGDKTDLDANINSLYSRNGISHLLALSGLHLSVIVSGSYKTLRRCGAGYLAAGISGTLLAGSYVIMTGGSVSVMRAAAMLSCSFLAACCGRTYDTLSALGLAAVVLLFTNPYRIFMISFQLSFGAIAGIGLVLPCLTGKGDCYLKQAFSSGLAVQAVTLPITLFHFYQFPIYGIFLNLIVIPLMVFVIVSGLAGIILGTAMLRLGRFAIGAGFVVLGIYERLCRAAEALPFAVMITGQPAVWQLAVYTMGLTIFVAVCGRKTAAVSQGKEAVSQGKEAILQGAEAVSQAAPASSSKMNTAPSRVRYRPSKRTVIQVSLLLFLQLLLFIRLPVPGVQVSFLDVGQGDGICIRSGYTTILSDAGSSDVKNLGKYRLEPYLKHQGIAVLDYVYISHGDTDHISGIEYLLKEGRDIRIKRLMLPAAGMGAPVYEELKRLVLAQGGAVYWIGAGDIRQIGELRISCLYPETGEPIADLNSHSLVLEVKYQAFRMLLTGDMGSREESLLLAQEGIRERLSQIQVLKIAHHGSRTSSSKEWLAAITPRWAVVSYGKDNSYGHPHKQVIEQLNEQGIKLFCTAESGAITLSADGKWIHFSEYSKTGAEDAGLLFTEASKQ